MSLIEDIQGSLFDDNPEYDDFTAKFEPKKTTDDCYTPPLVFEAVKEWACRTFDIDPAKIVRPFYPGGDYERFEYAPDAVVLDNPPFSILAKIVAFYLDRKIPFFLFAPALTSFSSKNTLRYNHVFCDAKIVYENGAVVSTGFVTSFGGDIVAMSAPDLCRAIDRAVAVTRETKTRPLVNCKYPAHVLTGAMLDRYSKYGVPLSVSRNDCVRISALDAQRTQKKAIFGGGLLLAERAAAERAAAERAAAERAAAERAAAERAAVTCELSARELAIVKKLGRGGVPEPLPPNQLSEPLPGQFDFFAKTEYE